MNQEIQKIYQAVGDEQLSEAFERLLKLVPPQQAPLLSRINDLENIYRQLLSYFAQGVKDEKQAEMLLYIRRKLLDITAQAAIESTVAQGSGLFYDRLRYRRSIGFESITTLLEQASNSNNRKQFDELVHLIFDSLWTSDSISEEEASALGKAHEYIRLVAASAITMSLQERWESHKFNFLLEQMGLPHLSPEYRARLLVGIVLTIQSYPHHAQIYQEEITARLEVVNEQISLESILQMFTIRFLFACETESITKQLQNELFNDMQKIAPDLQKFGINDLESMQETDNPEWIEELEKSGLGKKLQEFSELQIEGADVMHSSFMNLKGSSFFREMHNWFLPFDSAHSRVAPLLEGNIMMKQLLETIGQQLCNSDRYSFILSIESLPAALRGTATGAMGGDLELIKEQMKSDTPTSEIEKLDLAIKTYLQDLYRFYKVYERKNEFNDIFRTPISTDLPLLDKYLQRYDTLRQIAEFYFRRKHYKEAGKHFEELTKKGDGTDTSLFQKLGFSFQQQGLFAKALSAYEHAELIDTENAWLLKRMAHCYRQIQQPSNAANIYARLFEQHPKDKSLLLLWGNALVEDHQYNEALNRFYQYEFSVDNPTKAQRPIAWCLFLTGEYERAQNYYKTILEGSDTTHTDLLNAGHTALAMDNIPEAIKHYQKGLSIAPQGTSEFLADYMADLPVLLNANIEESTIKLIPEALRLQALSNS